MNPLKAKSPSVAMSKSVLKVRSLDDSESFSLKILAYGDVGTGKTYAIHGFLDLGWKVFVLSTDYGGDGLNTLRSAPPEKKANLRFIQPRTYEETQLFLRSPDKVFPEIYDWDPDVLVWDGFSTFHYQYVQPYILGFEAKGRDVSEMRELGLEPVLSDWSPIFRATMDSLELFLGLRNEKTGKAWHKYVTAHMQSDITPQLTPQQKRQKRGPLLQGSSKVIIGAGFDLVFVTEAVSTPSGTVYRYILDPAQYLTKARGIKLESKEPADMKALIEKIFTQLGQKV